MTYTQAVGLLWTRDRPVAETCTRQHSQYKNIHVPGGIRTSNPSKRRLQTHALGSAATGVGDHDFPLPNPFLFPIRNDPIV